MKLLCGATVASQSCTLTEDFVHVVLTDKRQFSNTCANMWHRPPLSFMHDLRVNATFVTMLRSMSGTVEASSGLGQSQHSPINDCERCDG